MLTFEKWYIFSTKCQGPLLGFLNEHICPPSNICHPSRVSSVHGKLSLTCTGVFLLVLFLFASFLSAVPFFVYLFVYFFVEFFGWFGFFSHEWLQKQLGQLKQEGGKWCSKGLWVLWVCQMGREGRDRLLKHMFSVKHL